MICLGIFYGKIIWGILLWKWHWTFDFYLDNYHEMGMKEIPIIWDLMENKLSLFDGTKHFWKTHERKLWMGIKKNHIWTIRHMGRQFVDSRADAGCWFPHVHPASPSWRLSICVSCDCRRLPVEAPVGWIGWIGVTIWKYLIVYVCPILKFPGYLLRLLIPIVSKANLP